MLDEHEGEAGRPAAAMGAVPDANGQAPNSAAASPPGSRRPGRRRAGHCTAISDHQGRRLKLVDDEGAASLLVPDDEHEGRPAAGAVPTADGQAIARYQPAIIGGED